jgi:hypothetical protein
LGLRGFKVLGSGTMTFVKSGLLCGAVCMSRGLKGTPSTIKALTRKSLNPSVQSLISIEPLVRSFTS